MHNSIVKYKTLDIHGMLELEAKKVLHDFIEECYHNQYYKIIVIHGYKKGQILKTMIWQKFNSPLVAKKQASLNLGETILWLKKQK